jgi:hypothetical protein
MVDWTEVHQVSEVLQNQAVETRRALESTKTTLWAGRRRPPAEKIARYSSIESYEFSYDPGRSGKSIGIEVAS